MTLSLGTLLRLGTVVEEHWFTVSVDEKGPSFTSLAFASVKAVELLKKPH